MEKFPSIVEDAMSSPVITVDGDTNVRDSAILMGKKEIGSIIVVDKGIPLGIVTKRDLMQRVVSLCRDLCRDVCEVRIKEIMSSPLITIEKNVGILKAMRKMREHKVTQLVIIEEGKLLGIISERDVIKAVLYASLASFTPLMRDRI
jgi:CBS domain-containing protein